MAILKIRDANGNIQEIAAIKGESYVLTDEDKQEIADLIEAEGTVDLSNYYTKEETDTQIASAVPKSVSELENDSDYVDTATVTSIITTQVPQGLSGFTNDMGFLTEDQVLDLIRSVMPSSGDEVSY